MQDNHRPNQIRGIVQGITPPRRKLGFQAGKSGNPGGKPKVVFMTSARVKQAMYDAFAMNGGLQGLYEWSNESPLNKREFYKMVINSLPRDLKVSGDIPKTIVYVSNSGRQFQVTDKSGVQPPLLTASGDKKPEETQDNMCG